MKAADYTLIAGFILAVIIAALLMAGSDHIVYPVTVHSPSTNIQNNTMSTQRPISFRNTTPPVPQHRNIRIKADRTGIFLVHIQGNISQHLTLSDRLFFLRHGQHHTINLTFTAAEPETYTGTVVLYRQNLPFKTPGQGINHLNRIGRMLPTLTTSS